MNIYRKTMMAIAMAAFSVGSACAQGSGGGESNSTSFQDWLNIKSANSARISRQEYMDESARRWDMMDKTKKGLTLAEIRGVYNPPANMGGPTATTTQQKKGAQQ